MSSHTVPNIQKIERLHKGYPDRWIYTGVTFLFMIGFFAFNVITSTGWWSGILYGLCFAMTILIWVLLFSTTKKLDRTFLFLKFYISHIQGKTRLAKYSMHDSRINRLLGTERFLPDGTIKFISGYGWLYAFDPDVVSKGDLESFTAKAQSLINSLSEDIIFKIEARIEPRMVAQLLTDRANELINTEKEQSRILHLQSIYDLSKEKETHDYDRRLYFFVGLEGKKELEEAREIKRKIEHGLKDRINNLNVIFSQIKDSYLLYEFYAGEFL